MKKSLISFGKWGFVFSVYALFMFIIDGYFGIGIKDPWNRFKDWRTSI